MGQKAAEIDVYEGIETHTGPECHSPGCRGYGNTDSGVVFIGIAPGRDEVKTGRPLTGPSGRIFNNILKQLETPRQSVYCTNLICWWKDDPSPEEAQRCSARLKRELLEIKPKLIVLLGKIVAEIFTGVPFGKVRGAVQWNEEYNCYVLTTYHPAALLHALNNRQGKGKEDTTIYDVVRDLRKIPYILKWEPEAPESKISYRVVTASDDAQNVLDNLPRNEDYPIAIDVETKYDKDDDEEIDVASDHLLCVGVGTENYCWVFTPSALFKEDGSPALNWPEGLWYTMHNSVFDAQVMKQDLGVWIEVKEDTMLQSYSLDERSGVHKLKTLAREYLAAPFWEEADRVDLTSKAKTKKKIPLDQLPPHVLYNYNAHDVVYTARLCKKLKQWQLEDTFVLDGEPGNMRGMYERILIPAVNMYKEISFHGVYIDKKLQDVFAYVWGKQWIEDEAYLQEQAKEAGWVGDINFNSPKQLGELLFRILSLPVTKYTDTGNPSTDKEVLDELAENNEFVADLVAFRRLTKMLNTYVFRLKELIRADGRAHPKVKLHSSVGGRPSFVDPALQTIPAPYQYEDNFGKLRQLFRATPGSDINVVEDDPYVIVDADLGKAEIWMAYTYSGDPQMYADLTSGDYHSVTASDVMKKPIEEVTKQNRVDMKRVTFGVMYWREALSLSKAIKSTVEQAQEYIHRFFVRNKKYKEWFDETAETIRLTGELVTKTGRKRRIIILGSAVRALKQAVNFPIQSTANDVLLDAAVEIHKKIKEQKIDGHILITVHDAIVTEVRQSQVELVYKIVHDAMTARRFKGIHPIPVEIKVGSCWGDTHEVHDCSKGEWSELNPKGNKWGGGFCLWPDPALAKEAVA